MSFCSQFRTLSKLVIVAMEIRGRHRGLPYALDRAILLPSERLHRVETEDLTRRMHQQQQQTESEPIQQPGAGTADGLPISSPFRRRRRRNSVTAGTGVGVTSTGDAPASTTATTAPVPAGPAGMKPKGKGLGGFLQGALSAGPVWASAWKGV